MKIFTKLLLLLFCAALAPPALAWVSKAEKAQVRQYCAEYARAVADAGLQNSNQEIESKFKKSNFFLRAFNKTFEGIFHPRDYRFATGYDCRFRNADKTFAGEVTLLLTRYKEHADYQRSDRIMFLDFGRVMDKSGELAYYVLPKYLEVNGDVFSVSDEKRF
ncbi:MAG: hypothetical protein OD817_06890 [Gammaproteobacteria bacterium]